MLRSVWLFCLENILIYVKGIIKCTSVWRRAILMGVVNGSVISDMCCYKHKLCTYISKTTNMMTSLI